MSVLQGVFAVSLLGTSAWLISRAAEHPPVMYLMVAVVGVRGFALGRAAGRYAERVLLHNSTFKMLSQQRPKILQKLIPLAPAGLPDRGATISNLVNDVDDLQNLPVRVIAPLSQSVGVSILAIGAVTWLLPQAGLALAVYVLGAFFAALPLSGWASKKTDLSTSPGKAQLSQSSLELLENLDVATAYGWLPQKFEEIDRSSKRLASLASKGAFSAGLGQSIISIFTISATVLLAWIGAESVGSGHTAGVTLAVFALLPMALLEVILAAQPSVSAWQRYKSAAKTVGALLDAEVPAEIKASSGVLKIEAFEGLTFTDVSARYPHGPLVLSNLSFQITTGQKVLLHGSSGSGKSTVANICLGFLNPLAGIVCVNGNKLGEIDSNSLRQVIGMVEQQPTIFRGSLRENLALAKSNLTDDQMIAALTSVKLWKTFAKRQGLHTQLGERGVSVSGGEAQRIGVARAILADFQLLILDEPTANVDQETAMELMTDLLNAAGSRSVLLITHDARLGGLTDRQVLLS